MEANLITKYRKRKMAKEEHKQIAKKLLNRLIEMENANLSNGVIQKIWTHTEFDSMQTEFESLSNAAKIGMKTTLKGTDLNILMSVFEQLHEDHFGEIKEWHDGVDIRDCTQYVEETYNNQHKYMSDAEFYKTYKKYWKTQHERGQGDNIKVRRVEKVYSPESLRDF